jgi:type I restriction enzyme S subunit
MTGGTIKFVNKKTMGNISTPIPPMALQEQFATFVEQTDKSKFEIQQSLEKLETLKKALMQKYFG